MYRRVVLAALIACTAIAAEDIVKEVRAAIARNDFTLGEKLIRDFKARQGMTLEAIEAVSWLGRGALAVRQFDRADAYAMEARKLALAQLTKRKLDAEEHLPLALGASIEVQAQVMDARGERDQAVAFLRRELVAYRNSSIRARIQKNIHLLSLEGKPAPALDAREWLGSKPATLDQLKGRPVVLFFWAHWCSDCKRLAPDLARIAAEHGVTVVGPTQRYGYVAGGADATPDVEITYIDRIRQQHYSSLSGMAVPVSEENFRNYGSSSSPTLVFIDRGGIVRLYHPGAMSYPELVAGAKRIAAD
jgi:thiol-disulfide isomerase/thioredoxin